MTNEQIEKELKRIDAALTKIREVIDDDKSELLSEIKELKKKLDQCK
jgi:hypothetical protein